MSQAIIYLLKVSGAIAGFYALYYLLFRREKQFTFNRFYLVLSLAAGFLIPLITLRIPGHPVQYVLPGPALMISPGAGITVSANNRDITGFLQEIILYGYGSICLVLSIRLLYGYLTIYRIMKKGDLRSLHGQEVIVTGRDLTPFSFFNKIIIPQSLLSSPDLPAIIEHEKVHTRDWHSIDLLVTELVTVIHWFNPVIWFLKRSVRINLEYIADHNVISDISDIENYQMAMVRLADKKPVTILANTLYVSQLKNRIIMMKRKNFSHYPVLKKLAIVPLMLIIVLIMSEKIDTTPFKTNNEFEIKGKVVTAEDNTPLPRALINIKGGNKGVFTDINGEFSISSNHTENKLVVQAVGYEKQEITVRDEKPIIIRLKKGDTSNHEISNNGFTISGKVISMDDHKPLSRVAILIKGRTDGTITDQNGNYIIPVNKSDEILVYSLPGFNVKEVKINNRKEINVELKKGNEPYNLDETAKPDKTAKVSVYADTINVYPDSTKKGSNHIYVTGKTESSGDEVLIKGKVIATATAKPLGSMNIIIQGTHTGTITDQDGNFILKVNKNDKRIIVADPIGEYKLKEIDLSQNINFDKNINLKVPVEVNVELDPAEK